MRLGTFLPCYTCEGLDFPLLHDKLRKVYIMSMSYDFLDGHLIKIDDDRPQNAWTIFDAPTSEIRAACQWNDANGDFESLTRETLLEVFLHDFIVSRINPLINR